MPEEVLIASEPPMVDAKVASALTSTEGPLSPLPEDWDSIFEQATVELEEENYDDAGEKWYTLADYAHEAGDKSKEALCRGHVATCFIMLGQEYAREAQTHYHHALALAEEADDHKLQVDLLNKMAGFYSRLGEVHRTIACLNRLLELHDISGDTEAELHVMGSLAGISYDTEDYEMAVKHYIDVLERAKVLGDNELIGKVYCNLGIAHQELEQFEQAIDYYSQSLELAKELGNKEMEGLAYSNLADAYSTQEEYDEASDYLDQTIAVYVELGDKAAEGKARAELSIAKHHIEENDDAIENMEQAVKLAQETEDKMAEAERLMQLGSLKLVARSDNPGAEALLNQSIEVWRNICLSMRKQLLTEWQSDQQMSDNPKAVSFLQQHAAAYTMLQKSLVAQDKKQLALEAAEEGRAKALHDLMVLCDDLTWETAESAAMSCAAMQQLAENQQSSIVVYSMVEPDQLLYIWTIPATGGEPLFTQVDLEALSTEHGNTVNGAVQKLYESMAALSGQMLCRGPAQAQEEGEEGESAAPTGADIPELTFLFKALVAPVIDQLPSDKDVVFVPHGVLNLVPFAALKNDSGVPLIKSHALSVSPSVRTFAAMASRAAAPSSDSALVVGHPEILPQFELPALPGTEEESKEIAAAIGSDSVTTLVGAEARMQKVVQEMQNVSTIHFACHGQPGILYLGPTLPTGNEPDSPIDEEDDEEEEQYDDGLLYREHLHFLHLPAKPSVVLSCNYSAAGSITEDGILGLPRGFLAAGARSVLSTLWVVPDDSATSFMKIWHAEAKTAGTQGSQAKALQTAMLQTMEASPTAHPLYWAGYMLFGNPSQYKAPPPTSD
jgi:CHAT domain-containing protein